MRLVRLLPVGILAAGLLASASARADDAAAPVVPGASPRTFDPVIRYPPSSVRPKLVVGGLAITALAWGAGYLVATNSPDVPGSTELKFPVVGPWIALAKNDCGPYNPTCGASLYGRAILLAVEGLVQLGGLGIAGEGLFMTTEADAAAPKAKAFLEWRGREGLSVMPTPLVTARMSGLGFTGTF